MENEQKTVKPRKTKSTKVDKSKKQTMFLQVVACFDFGRHLIKAVAKGICLALKNTTVFDSNLKRNTNMIFVDPDKMPQSLNINVFELKINTDSGDGNIESTSVFVTDEDISRSEDFVDEILTFRSDDTLLDHAHWFLLYELAYALWKNDVSSDYSIDAAVVVPLTKEMKDNGKRTSFENLIKSASSFEIAVYKGKPSDVPSYKTTVNKIEIMTNPQGSQAINYFIFDEDGNSVMGLDSAQLEVSEATIFDRLHKFKEINRFTGDYIHIDLSSTEMTVSVSTKNSTSFTNVISVMFGSSKIYEKVRIEINEENGTAYTLNQITEAHLGKTSIKDRLGSEIDVVSKFNACFVNNFQSKVEREIELAINELKHVIKREGFNPEFIVLSGGGMLSVNDTQSPYMPMIAELIKKFIDPGLNLNNEHEVMSRILPHGLYRETNYKIKDTKMIAAHSLGTTLSLAKWFEKQGR